MALVVFSMDLEQAQAAGKLTAALGSRNPSVETRVPLWGWGGAVLLWGPASRAGGPHHAGA